jgi:hypothetical protein
MSHTIYGHIRPFKKKLLFLELELGCMPNNILHKLIVELLHGGVGGAELQKTRVQQS